MSDKVRVCFIIPFIEEKMPEWTPNHRVIGNVEMYHKAFLDAKEYLRERSGFTRSVNHVARDLASRPTTRPKYIVIWNSDAAMDVRDVPKLIEPMEMDPRIAAVAPGRTGADKTIVRMSEDVIGQEDGNPVAVAWYELCAIGPMAIMKQACDDRVYYVTGTGYSPLFAARLEAWVSVGGYDEAYAPGYYEDADIWRKFRLFGWHTVAVPSVHYTHGDDEGESKSFRKLHSMEELVANAGRNLDIYRRKWEIGASIVSNHTIRPSLIDPWRRKAENDPAPESAPPPGDDRICTELVKGSSDTGSPGNGGIDRELRVSNAKNQCRYDAVDSSRFEDPALEDLIRKLP